MSAISSSEKASSTSRGSGSNRRCCRCCCRRRQAATAPQESENDSDSEFGDAFSHRFRQDSDRQSPTISERQSPLSERQSPGAASVTPSSEKASSNPLSRQTSETQSAARGRSRKPRD